MQRLGRMFNPPGYRREIAPRKPVGHPGRTPILDYYGGWVCRRLATEYGNSQPSIVCEGSCGISGADLDR